MCVYMRVFVAIVLACLVCRAAAEAVVDRFVSSNTAVACGNGELVSRISTALLHAMQWCHAQQPVNALIYKQLLIPQTAINRHATGAAILWSSSCFLCVERTMVCPACWCRQCQRPRVLYILQDRKVHSS
jgi:hypothetical protein